MSTTRSERELELTRRAKERLYSWMLSGGRAPNPRIKKDRLAYLCVLRDAATAELPINQIMARTGRAQTYRVLRAVVRRFDCAELRECLDQLASDSCNAQSRALLLDRLQAALTRLEQCDTPMSDLQPSIKRRNANAMRRAPPDWQQSMIDAAKGPLRIALCVLSLTGCRLGEIEHGFGFRIGSKDTEPRLSLLIKGNKVDENRGQPSRTFVFKANDRRPEIDLLAEALKAECQGVTEGQYPARRRIGRKIAALTRKLWPRLSRWPSARSFRYAHRRALALQGFSSLEIAAQLGHRSTESQLAYGRPMIRGLDRERLRQRAREPEYDSDESHDRSLLSPLHDLEIEPHDPGPRPDHLPGGKGLRERESEREREFDWNPRERDQISD